MLIKNLGTVRCASSVLVSYFAVFTGFRKVKPVNTRPAVFLLGGDSLYIKSKLKCIKGIKGV